MERVSTLQAELTAIDKRLPELEKLVQSAYEDKVMGRIPENLCIQLLNGYEAERSAKPERRKELTDLLSACRENEKAMDDRMDMMRLIRKIEISEGYTDCDHEERDINICYNFVGFVGFIEVRCRKTHLYLCASWLHPTSRSQNPIVIDVEIRWIIEKIFDLAFNGAGAAKITGTLVEEQVPTARWLNFKRYGKFAHIYEEALEEKSYAWTVAQVKGILKDGTYIGNSAHNKQTNISYKKKVRKTADEWYRVEHTHEAIISGNVFYQVQEQIASRRREQKDGMMQKFAGLVRCADCGWSMNFGTNKQNKNPYSYFNCTSYKKHATCTAHYIRYDMLYTYVLARVQYWAQQAQADEVKLPVLAAQGGRRGKERTDAKTDRRACQSRKAKGRA